MMNPMRILVQLVLNWKFWEVISRCGATLSAIGCICIYTYICICIYICTSTLRHKYVYIHTTTTLVYAHIHTTSTLVPKPQAPYTLQATYHPTRYSLPITLHATAYLSPYTLQPTYHPTRYSLPIKPCTLHLTHYSCTRLHSYILSCSAPHATPYTPSTLHATAYLLSPASYTYGVPTFGTLLKIVRLFFKISSLLQNIVSVLRLFCKRAL